MADNNLLEQMLEHLVNEDKEKAEELFHQYVVEKSREIYETLLDENVEDLEEEDEEEDEDKEEVEESFLELDLDEEDDDTVDPADDLINDVDDEEEMDNMDMDGEGEEDTEELFQDLESIVDELQAKFDELQGDSENDMDDMDVMDTDAEETEEDFSFESKEEYDELATIKEYVDRVAGGHGAEQKGSAESADNKKSTIDNMKNDMGGTASNLNQAEEAKGGSESGLSSNSPKDMNTGNVNTPGSKNATNMSNEPGHGAEKKGSAEQADNKNSLFK